MAIYIITKEISDDGETYYDTTVYRSSKVAFDRYISHISAVIWDFNTYLDSIIDDIKLYGKDKAPCMVNIGNTIFSFSDTDEAYGNITLQKKEYNSDQEQYLCSEFNLKFTKKRIKDVIERVKLLRNEDKRLEGHHEKYFEYWTDEKIETLVKDIFKYGF